MLKPKLPAFTISHWPLLSPFKPSLGQKIPLLWKRTYTKKNRSIKIIKKGNHCPSCYLQSHSYPCQTALRLSQVCSCPWQRNQSSQAAWRAFRSVVIWLFTAEWWSSNHRCSASSSSPACWRTCTSSFRRTWTCISVLLAGILPSLLLSRAWSNQSRASPYPNPERQLALKLPLLWCDTVYHSPDHCGKLQLLHFSPLFALTFPGSFTPIYTDIQGG